MDESAELDMRRMPVILTSEVIAVQLLTAHGGGRHVQSNTPKLPVGWHYRLLGLSKYTGRLDQHPDHLFTGAVGTSSILQNGWAAGFKRTRYKLGGIILCLMAREALSNPASPVVPSVWPSTVLMDPTYSGPIVSQTRSLGLEKALEMAHVPRNTGNNPSIFPHPDLTWCRLAGSAPLEVYCVG